MKGLLTKDFLTIKKKYGLPRVIMDIAIIIALMFILEMIIPGISEPPVRTLRATIPENERHIFR